MLMIKLFTAQFIGLLALFSNIAFAQFDVSESVTASASFPDVAMTCIGNLAVFFSCLLRGRLHVEMGARDLLDTIRPSKLIKVRDGCIKTLYSPGVVMLSNHTPDSSMMQFMQYSKNTYNVGSILLQFHRLRSGEVTAEICNSHRCNCIVLDALHVTTTFHLVRWIPGTLKRLSGSDHQCLLPCLTCLRNCYHGCNHSLLHVNQDILIEGEPKEWPIAAVCEILDRGVDTVCQERTCICIPTLPAERDEWTKMLIRSLKTKDKEGRGVTNLASDHLKRYIDQSGVCDATEEYSTVYLIVPRLTEVLVNIILTAWFRVDGFSSALVARRVVRDYIVDSRGTAIAANVFLTKCQVYSNEENTNVCQVLTFRGSLLSFRTLSSIIGCVNLICSIAWAVLIAGADKWKWYDTLSMAPSKARVAVVIAAIGVALAIDCLQLFLYCRQVVDEDGFAFFLGLKFKRVFTVLMILEIGCIISGDGYIVLYKPWFGSSGDVALLFLVPILLNMIDQWLRGNMIDQWLMV